MGQVLIRNVPDDTIDSYKQRAELNGRSLEQELRDLLERNKTFTAEERVALSRRFHAQNPQIQPSLTSDQIREGLM
jgi:antitoxin FitA